MNLKEKLQLAWDNRTQIADGLYNKYIESSEEIKAEAQRRKQICESNACGWYDPTGKPETSAIPGKPTCSICHCNISLKIACMSCWCALQDIGQSPLWEPLMSKEMDDRIHADEYVQQFKKKTDESK